MRFFSLVSLSYHFPHSNTCKVIKSIHIKRSVLKYSQFLFQPELFLSRHLTTSRSDLRTRKMSSVSVKNFEEDDRLHIYLDLKIVTLAAPDPKPISMNLSRFKDEELRLALDRLRLNISKKLSKKTKKKAQPSKGVQLDPDKDNHLQIHILHNGKALDLSVSNINAWIDGATLLVGEEEVPILYNPPSATLEKLPNIILGGCPVFPSVETEFTSKDLCKFYWKTFEPKYLDKFKAQISKGEVEVDGVVSSESFTPKAEDVGKHILLTCIPKLGHNCGKPVSVVSQSAVSKGPGLCPFEIRHKNTNTFSQVGCFRVVSYNILADVYTDSDFARDELFSYCASQALTMDYRKHLILKEIIGYYADLVCLQEVDKHIFTNHLTPAMQALGYDCLFKPKSGGVTEGCASFIRKDKFRVLTSHDVVLSEYLKSDCADLWTEVSKVRTLREKIEDRASILQVTVVESVETPGQLICLANVHLYFHPSADNIRLLHAATALRKLCSVCDSYTQEGKTIAIVFCGDFNSAPHLGVYQLMTSQMVPRDNVDWISGYEEDALTTLDLYQPVNMVSACGTPPYTNFTRGFVATLDYIFIDSDILETTKVVPMITDEEVKASIAIPSSVIPSDHLALVCEIKFK